MKKLSTVKPTVIRFCSECGKRLIYKKDIIISYSSITGKPNIREVWICPLLKHWYIRIFTFGHNEEWFVKEGQQI